MKRNTACAASVSIVCVLVFATGLAFADDNGAKTPLIPQLAPLPTFSDSTVPPNGDMNPYGVAFVPHGFPGGGPGCVQATLSSRTSITAATCREPERPDR